MEEEDKEVIRQMYVRLERNLEATKVMGYLYQEHVLNEEDVDKIQAKATSKKKAEKLLKILKRRQNGLKMLIKALLVTKVQAFLGHEMLERVSWSEEEMESFNLEVDGEIDPWQMLQADLTALRQKNKQLQLKFDLLKEKLIVEENTQKRSHSSGSHQFFQKLWRSMKQNKPESDETAQADLESDVEFNAESKNQSCQTSKPPLICNLNIIYDDLGANWTDAGRRWSGSVYEDRKPMSRGAGRRRRSFNDSISRSSTSLKNTILGVFGKRKEMAEREAANDCQSTDSNSDTCSDTCSDSTDLTLLS